MQTLKCWTHEEIHSQPEAWAHGLSTLQSNAHALRELWKGGDYEQVLFTGCGSPYYAGMAIATLLREQMGLLAEAQPASEVWLNPRAAYAQNKRILLVALSRSGETTEVLNACEAFRARKQGDIVTLSCNPHASLAKVGDLNIVLISGQETSLAQTRAFTTLYLAGVACGAIWAGNDGVLDEMARLPEVGRRMLPLHESIAHNLGADQTFDRYYFLGSGPRYGLACELSLKVKEMSLGQSEPFHFLEFRHGPQSMVNPNTLIIGLLSETNYDREMAVLNDVAQFGGRLLPIGEQVVGTHAASFNSGLSEAVRQVLYLPVGQMLGLERALSKGLNPDQPHQLNAYVKL